MSHIGFYIGIKQHACYALLNCSLLTRHIIHIPNTCLACLSPIYSLWMSARLICYINKAFASIHVRLHIPKCQHLFPLCLKCIANSSPRSAFCVALYEGFFSYNACSTKKIVTGHLSVQLYATWALIRCHKALISCWAVVALLRVTHNLAKFA